ncbi:MAG: alpha/beta hydrolase [Xenococcaceae cyanobacterium MO_188.B32]|nr:alpha/beta hydrolase [Xenococcaceae cyanobacterium MO_188.B32]
MIDREREGTFQGANGVKLYYQSWHPQALAKAILVIVPGHGGHSGTFTRMVAYLVERNYIIYSFDLRGNGRSPGQRGYINSWAEFRADLTAFLNLVTAKKPALPLFLIGQSMGGTIALDYVLRESDRLQGLILMAPALGLGVSAWKLWLGKILSRIWPHFALDTGIDLSAGSRDPEVVAAFARDTLRHSQGTARLATELLKTINWINDHATELKVPLLILHGGADRVTLPEDSRIFWERLTLADKERREYPDSYHELHNDLNYQEVLTDIEDWLNRHL